VKNSVFEMSMILLVTMVVQRKQNEQSSQKQSREQILHIKEASVFELD
jgi:hypothetical protein